jgi:hypothetical protein
MNFGIHDCKVWVKISLCLINETPRHEDAPVNCNVLTWNEIGAKRGLDK